MGRVEGFDVLWYRRCEACKIERFNGGRASGVSGCSIYGGGVLGPVVRDGDEESQAVVPRREMRCAQGKFESNNTCQVGPSHSHVIKFRVRLCLLRSRKTAKRTEKARDLWWPSLRCWCFWNWGVQRARWRRKAFIKDK